MRLEVEGKIYNVEKKDIEDLCSDLIANFFYYNRKEDEEFPVGIIEEAVKAKLISKEDILNFLNKKITERLEGYN